LNAVFGRFVEVCTFEDFWGIFFKKTLTAADRGNFFFEQDLNISFLLSSTINTFAALEKY